MGSAVSPSPVRRVGVGESPRADDAHIFLGGHEVQAVADTHPTALRTLLLPDYNGVASAFARLLQRVVQRCKWDGQASGKKLLGQEEERDQRHEKPTCVSLADELLDLEIETSIISYETNRKGGYSSIIVRVQLRWTRC